MTTFEIYASTEVGLVRRMNEDHILIGRFVKNSGTVHFFIDSREDFFQRQGLLFAVADGIGGESGGEIASHLAIRALDKNFYTLENKRNIQEFIETLQNAISKANDTVLHISLYKKELAYMGCTLTGICLTTQGFIVFNTGDSRVYHYASPRLTLLTVDDTAAQKAFQEGRMTAVETEHSIERHHLTNYIGYFNYHSTMELKPALQKGDMLLICSDGLYDLLGNKRLEKVFCEYEKMELPQLGKYLSNQAITYGGYDNISLILIRSN
jgi:serine/threonine protein phosphatase PrpC